MLVIGLVVIMLFESVLNVLRSYVMSHTTSRIDVELGARLFRHLLNLPLAYFQARRVGDSVARIRELENIRQFLTGNALTLVLDVLFSVIFIAVMFAYSVPLTLIVLVSLPLYLILSLAIVPILRGRLNEKFARGAENQSLLVETVTGIQTVKASALEPQMARRWDEQLAAYVSASFKTQTLAQYGHEGVNLIGKLVNAATLWYGAHLVIEGSLTVGMFVRVQYVRRPGGAAHHADRADVDRLPADGAVYGPPGRHPQHPHRAAAPKRQPAAPHPRPGDPGPVDLSATALTPSRCSRASALDVKAGEVIGIVGAQRLGQEYADQADPAPVRARERSHPGRRP